MKIVFLYIVRRWFELCCLFASAYSFELCLPHFLNWFAFWLKEYIVRKFAIISLQTIPLEQRSLTPGGLMALLTLELCPQIN